MSLGYQDVCTLPDGTLAYVTAEDRAVVARGLWSAPVRRQWLDLRAGMCGGHLVAIGKESDSSESAHDGGTVWITIDGAPVWEAGLTFGANSVAVGPDGLYIVRSSTRIDVVSLAGVLLRVISASVGSQGIRDVTLAGELRLGDAWMTRVRDGLTLYQPMERGAVMVGQADPPQIAGDGPQGLFTALTGFAYEPHVAQLGDGRYAICARPWTSPVFVPPYAPLVTPTPVPPVEPPAPIGDPRPADGRTYDLLSFILGDPSLWPRSGPGHPMHQHVVGDLFHFVKFGNPEAYETWASDAEWIYHLEDASGSGPERQPYHFSDPRWFPRRLAIGVAHAFETGEHRMISTRRSTCEVIADHPFWRTMWVEAIYDRYWWGADLGERPTLVVAYDPTAGQHIPERGVELGFFAQGAGSVRWEYHDASIVYASGTPVFSDASRKARSDFYLLGGTPLAPKLSGCVPQHVPTPTPIPPEPPDPFPQPPELPMSPIRCALRLGEFFIAANPAAPAPYPGWVAVAWGASVDRHSPEAEFEVTAPTQTAKLMVKSVSTGMLLNTDLTAFSGNLATALALKPTAGGIDGWDSYEQWNGWSLDGGIDTVVVEYDRDGERYTGLMLTVVPR